MTTETQCFVSVISNLRAAAESVRMQVDDHVKIRLTSQLVNDISRVLQKLLKCFNGAVISTSFVLPLAVFPIIFTLFLLFY